MGWVAGVDCLGRLEHRGVDLDGAASMAWDLWRMVVWPPGLSRMQAPQAFRDGISK